MKKFLSLLINCLLLFFIIVLVYHIYQYSQNIIYTSKIIVHDNPIIVGVLFLLLLTITLFIKFSKIDYKKIQYEKHYTVISLILLGILLVTGSISIIKTKILLDADPKEYYQVAIDIINKSKNFDLYNIYHKRVLLYTIPIFKLFPQSLMSVKIINLILVALTGIGYTFLTYKISGKKTSLLFSLLYVIYPTHYYVINLVSHDLISNFYLMLFLLNIYFIIRYSINFKNWKILGLLIFTAAVLLTVNELQRSTAMFVIGSMIINFFYSYAKKLNINKLQWSSFLSIIILFFTFNFLAYTFLGVNNKSEEPVYSNAGRLYSYNNLHTNGTYFTGEEERLVFFPLVDIKLWNKIAITKYLTQFVNYPVQHLKLILDKTSVLLNSSPHAHYFAQFINNNFNPRVEIVYILLRFAILIFAGIAYLKQYTYNNIMALAVFIIPIFLLFMMFSEVNTYYSFVLIPLLLFIASKGITDIKTIIISKKSFFNVIQTCIVFLLIFTSIYAGSAVYVKQSSTKLVDFSNVNYKTKNFNISTASGYDDIYKISGNLILEPNDTSTIHISNIKEYKSGYFFIKTNLIIDHFKLMVNGDEQKLNNYNMRDFRNSGLKTYAFISFENLDNAKELEISIEKTDTSRIGNVEFQIKDIFLN